MIRELYVKNGENIIYHTRKLLYNELFLHFVLIDSSIRKEIFKTDRNIILEFVMPPCSKSQIRIKKT